jgi:hypothetical protein
MAGESADAVDEVSRLKEPKLRAEGLQTLWGGWYNKLEPAFLDALWVPNTKAESAALERLLTPIHECIRDAIAVAHGAQLESGKSVSILIQDCRATLRVAKQSSLLKRQPPTDFVTLDQLAGVVKRSKKTLERYKKQLGKPVVRGGRGRAAQWSWALVRPRLEKIFEVRLPVVFPGHRH